MTGVPPPPPEQPSPEGQGAQGAVPPPLDPPAPRQHGSVPDQPAPDQHGQPQHGQPQNAPPQTGGFEVPGGVGFPGSATPYAGGPLYAGGPPSSPAMPPPFGAAPPPYAGGYHYPPPRTAARGFAITSLVLGISSLVLGFIPVLGLGAAVLAVTFGLIALISKKHGGAGFAAGGVATGVIGVLLGIFVIYIFNAMQGCIDQYGPQASQEQLTVCIQDQILGGTGEVPRSSPFN